MKNSVEDLEFMLVRKFVQIERSQVGLFCQFEPFEGPDCVILKIKLRGGDLNETYYC